MNADRAMCAHPTCPLRTNCTRHAESGTKPDPVRQVYVLVEPRFVIRLGLGSRQCVCEYYEPKEPQ